MKKNRTELEKKLNILINEYGNDRKKKPKILEYFKQKNYKLGIVHDILTLRVPLATINNTDLGLLTTAMYRVTSNESVNPQTYFTDLEIDEINKFKIDIEDDDNRYPIIFEDVIQMNGDQWCTVISAQRLLELYNKVLIKYNYETQRQAKIKETHAGSIVKEVDINKNSVKAIEQDISDNSFISNFITLNVLQNGEDDIIFDIEKRRIIINSGEVNIVDGFHRSLSILEAVVKNKNIDFRIGVMITNFSVDKARRFIVQEDKKNLMKKDYIKSIDIKNLSNNITQKLNEDANFHLNGEITNNTILIRTGEKKVNSTIITDTIQNTFNPSDRKELIKDYKVIKERLNYIIEYNDKLLETPAEDQMVWAFYICLVYASRNLEKWEEYIDNNINKIEIIDDIKTVSKKSVKKILDYIS